MFARSALGFNANRQVGSQGGAWYTGLGSLLGVKNNAPVGGGVPTNVNDASLQDLLDRLSVKNRPAPNTTGLSPQLAAALTTLSQPNGAVKIDAKTWEALGQAYMSTSGVGRSQLAQALQAGGFHAEASTDGKYVTFTNGAIYATVEPSTNRLRFTNGNAIGCYAGPELIKTMSVSGNTVTVRTDEGEEVWDSQTGKGTINGRPIQPQAAAVVPYEAPRGPMLESTTDDLQEPAWNPSEGLDAYGDQYDAAVKAMGGQVVSPSQTGDGDAEQFNCHSFSLTGGQGDLFDTFSRPGYPHWLNNPMSELTTGNYGLVAPTQRVHPGDVIVYVKDGAVTHTGVVREVDANGNPSLIESKFGALGLYLHDPYDVPGEYGAPEQIFRPQT